MAVEALVTLPDQPAQGTTIEQPLGGNGWTAPHSAHACDISVVSDGTGGASTLRVHTDPRWTCVIAYMLSRVTTPTADYPLSQIIVMGRFAGFCQVTGVVDISDAPTGKSAGRLWTPPGIIGTTSEPPSSGTPMYGESVVNNIDTEAHSLHIRVYNFEKDAQRRVPLSVLLASLPRGSNLQ